ncbi:MAG: radical SAM protein [Treponema sp.]|nr:radical SAM protein [Treponema sp.]
MLRREILTNTISYYNIDKKIIFVNSNNSKWFVINEIEFKTYSNVIRNKSENTEEYSKLLKKKFFESVPRYSNKMLQFYVTNMCNLKCPHCYMRCQKEIELELSFDEKKKVLKDFYENGGRKILFTGGEVMMSPDFLDLLEYTKRFFDTYIIVLTNGTLWDEEKIEICSKYIDEVQISIDGYSEATNSKIRGKGAFDKSLKCVDSFLSRDITVTLAMTPLHGFENELEKYSTFGKELVDKYKDKSFYLVFADGLLQGRSVDWIFEKNLIYAQNSEKILNDIYPDYIIGSFAEIHSQPLQNCGYGKIVLDSNGDFTFCTCIKDIPKLGNIRNTSMKKIFEMSDKISQKTCIDNLEPCKNCDFKYICGDKCRMEYFRGSNNICNVDMIPRLTLRCECTEAYKRKILEKMLESFERL